MKVKAVSTPLLSLITVLCVLHLSASPPGQFQDTQEGPVCISRPVFSAQTSHPGNAAPLKPLQPSLGAVRDTSMSGRRTGAASLASSGGPASTSQPLGMSTLIRGMLTRVRDSRMGWNWGRTGGLKLNPNMASTTRLYWEEMSSGRESRKRTSASLA